MKIASSRLLVIFVSVFTFSLGLVNLLSLLNYPIVSNIKTIQKILSIELVSFSRFATLVIGLLLIVTSVNIYKRKRRALHVVIILSFLSAVFHFLKGPDYLGFTLSIILLLTIYILRENFTVKSSFPEFSTILLRVVLMIMFGLVYAILGFWLLDKNQFGVNFNIYDSVKKTFDYILFIGDVGLVPRTKYSKWFLDSLSLISVTIISYLIYSVFRPVVYIYSTLPSERKLAEKILGKYSKSSQDYFKLWHDKSYFFSQDKTSFVSYAVAMNYAIALSDPAGPREEIPMIIRDYISYCEDNDWKIVFHQVLEEYLGIYEELGFRKLKIGDDAIVDLSIFTLEGKDSREFRYILNKLNKIGMRFVEYKPPVPDNIVSELKAVSDEWLKIANRKERKFTVGMFEDNYIKSSSVFAVVDNLNRIQAFINLIDSFCYGECTVDLMRRRNMSPNGVMDYLFINLFLNQKAKGIKKFNIGMAPLSGYVDSDSVKIEEKTLKFIIKNMNFIFSFEGLKNFKAKYANYWVPRYIVYKNPLELPGYAVALAKLSSVSREELNSIQDNIHLETLG